MPCGKVFMLYSYVKSYNAVDVRQNGLVAIPFDMLNVGEVGLVATLLRQVDVLS